MKIPDFLNTERPHKSNPYNTDLGHTTATEKALYNAIQRAILAHYNALNNPLIVLDACCASGGCAWNTILPQTTKSLTLLDNDPIMCQAAISKPWKIPSVVVTQTDAIHFKSSLRFDLILANSAYHHIPDAHKIAFLQNMAAHLSPTGRILLGEHFLPDYCENSLEEYRNSVMTFYSARIEALTSAKDTPEAIDVIRQTGLYCWNRNYEYQVSQRIFREHIVASTLQVESQIPIWPTTNHPTLPKNSGTFLLTLKQRNNT